MLVRLLHALALSALLGLAACGGSGGSSRPPGTATPPSGTPSPGTPSPGTPSPGTPSPSPRPGTPTATAVGTPPKTPTPGGSPSLLPPIVTIARVVFRASNGETCCVAADPILLPVDPQPGQATLVLDDLPIGPATVEISGYTEDFAPAPDDVTTTCKTVNTTGVRPCDDIRNASAAFASAPKPITIFSGVKVNLGEVEVAALPFVLEFTPPQNIEVPLPVDLSFTVVDAETGIAGPSVGLEITLDVPQGQPPVFRPLTKRVPVVLDPCRDGSGTPCSPEGDFDLSGFKARGVAEYLSYLPAGPVAARITAQNLADPARDLDFRYVFVVLPGPTETPTPTSTTVPSSTPTRVPPSNTPTPTFTPTESPSATVTATRTLSATPTVTATVTATRVNTMTPTISPTRTPTDTPRPTPTTLCKSAPSGGCGTSGASLLRIEVSRNSMLSWRWLDGAIPLADFGDPTSTTDYALCIYDSTAGVPALVFAAQVEGGGDCARMPCWSRVGAPTRGYRLSDASGMQYGMERLLLRGGRLGSDTLQAGAGGDNLELPLPVSIDKFFAQQDDVIVQLVNNVNKCWQSTFRPRDVVHNLPELYEAER